MNKQRGHIRWLPNKNQPMQPSPDVFVLIEQTDKKAWWKVILKGSYVDMVTECKRMRQADPARRVKVRYEPGYVIGQKTRNL